MNKTYRCFTCGFALTTAADDPRSLEQINAEVHAKELAGVENKLECPACHGYLKRHGGRKPGRVAMPDITEAGIIEEETPEKKAQFEELNRDFQTILDKRGDGTLTALRQKYGSQKIFSYSVQDLVDWHDKIKAKKNK